MYHKVQMKMNLLAYGIMYVNRIELTKYMQNIQLGFARNWS